MPHTPGPKTCISDETSQSSLCSTGESGRRPVIPTARAGNFPALKQCSTGTQQSGLLVFLRTAIHLHARLGISTCTTRQQPRTKRHFALRQGYQVLEIRTKIKRFTRPLKPQPCSDNSTRYHLQLYLTVETTQLASTYRGIHGAAASEVLCGFPQFNPSSSTSSTS